MKVVTRFDISQIDQGQVEDLTKIAIGCLFYSEHEVVDDEYVEDSITVKARNWARRFNELFPDYFMNVDFLWNWQDNEVEITFHPEERIIPPESEPEPDPDNPGEIVPPNPDTGEEGEGATDDGRDENTDHNEE